MVFKTRVSHFKVKNIPWKDADGRESLKECSVLFGGQRRNLMFSSQCLACFETQPGGEVFEEFWCIFCTLCSRKWRFWKRNLCICKYLYTIYTFWDQLGPSNLRYVLNFAALILLAWTDPQARLAVLCILLLRIHLWLFESFFSRNSFSVCCCVFFHWLH